jgi:hypothetical protein
MAQVFGDGDRGEAEAERLAEIEHMYLPMKKWYGETTLKYKEVRQCGGTCLWVKD